MTHLVLTRPRQFKYKAGDYIFIQIPEMAAHEWHPFTISSAPEQTGVCYTLWKNEVSSGYHWVVFFLKNCKEGYENFNKERKTVTYRIFRLK